MIDELHSLRQAALSQLSPIWDNQQLEEWRVQFLGRKGALASHMERIGTLPKQERGAVGKLANEVKNALESGYQAKVGAIQQRALSESLETAPLDVTLPGRPFASGRLHPATQTLREIKPHLGRHGLSGVPLA